MMHILLVLPVPVAPDREQEVASSLRAAGHLVDLARGDEEALWLVTGSGFDALLIQRSGDDDRATRLCATLRGAGIWTPILILTPAMDAECLAALDAGADDFVTSPFMQSEVDARLRALVRRGQPERPSILSVGSIRLDPGARQVQAHGRDLPIVGIAFDLLELMMRREGQVTSRQQMADHLWDWAWEARSNTLEVHIHQLRSVLSGIPDAPSIDTLRGSGYRLRADPAPLVEHRRDARPRVSGSLQVGPSRVRAEGRVQANDRRSEEEHDEAIGPHPDDAGDHGIRGPGLGRQ